MLNRTIHGMDIATGETVVTEEYITEGLVESTFVNGNSTVTYDVIPSNATYNTTTNEPNPPYNPSSASTSDGSSRLLTRFERAMREADIMKARSTEDDSVARRRRRRAPAKTGRLALMEHYKKETPKRGHTRLWNDEL